MSLRIFIRNAAWTAEWDAAAGQHFYGQGKDVLLADGRIAGLRDGEVHDRMVAGVQPVAGARRLRPGAGFQAEDVAIKGAALLHELGRRADQVVVQSENFHGGSPKDTSEHGWARVCGTGGASVDSGVCAKAG